MKWSKQPPSQSGWYWFRTTADKKRIREVELFGPRTMVSGYDIDDFASNPEWAGPIPEPTESDDDIR